MVVSSRVAVPKKVAFEAGMIRPWTSISPRVSSACSSVLMARSGGPLGVRSGLGLGGGAPEPVGARAEVPGRVHRPAAERARLATGADHGLGALAERARQPGRHPHHEHLVGLRLLDLLLGGAGLDHGGLVERE